MKCHRFFLVFSVNLFCLLSLSIQAYSQTNITVKYLNDAEQSFSLSEKGKLYFDDKNLFISENGESVSEILISDIRNIRLNNNVSSIETDKANEAKIISVYPNPASDYIYLTNTDSEKVLISLFTIEGRLLMKTEHSISEPLNISKYPAGLYLIQVNSQTVKFIKQ